MVHHNVQNGFFGKQNNRHLVLCFYMSLLVTLLLRMSERFSEKCQRTNDEY